MKSSQQKRILNYLEKGNKIDALTALMKLGIFRLAARILELKERGFNIEDNWKTVKNRFGEKIKCKEYWLAS